MLYPTYCARCGCAGAVYFDVAATAPWVAEQPTREMVLPKILPGAGHLISYHVVTEGSCFAGIVGAGTDRGRSGRSRRLHQRRSACHVEQSRHARRSRHSGGIRRRRGQPAAVLPVNYGGGGGHHRSGWSAGSLPATAQPFNPLLDNLPAVIKAGNPQEGDSNWLGEFIRVAIGRSRNRRAGGEGVLAKLERADVHRGGAPAP